MSQWLYVAYPHLITAAGSTLVACTIKVSDIHGTAKETQPDYYNTRLTKTSKSRVLLEILTGSQLVIKLPAFYGTLRFIAVFTTAHHLSLAKAR
jgi:hypothetical protein